MNSSPPVLVSSSGDISSGAELMNGSPSVLVSSSDDAGSGAEVLKSSPPERYVLLFITLLMDQAIPEKNFFPCVFPGFRSKPTTQSPLLQRSVNRQMIYIFSEFIMSQCRVILRNDYLIIIFCW